MSAIACAGIAIIGTIARANFSHTVFSSLTMSDCDGTVPRRTVAVSPSRFPTIWSDARNSNVPPMYAGDCRTRKTDESGVKVYWSPVLVVNPRIVM